VGGAGGGAIWLEVANGGPITISGIVTANGGEGGTGGEGVSLDSTCDGQAGGDGAGGGGASGGTILLKGGVVAITPTGRLEARGGNGGLGGRGGTATVTSAWSASGGGGGPGGGDGRIKVFADVYNEGAVVTSAGASGRAGPNGSGARCVAGPTGGAGGSGSSNVVESWSDPYLRSAPVALIVGTEDAHATQSISLEPSRTLIVPDHVLAHQGALEATEEMGLRMAVAFTTLAGRIDCNYVRNAEIFDRLQLTECTGGILPGDPLEVTQLVAQVSPRLNDAILFFQADFLELIPMRFRQPPPSKFLTYAGTSVEVIAGEYMVIFDGAVVPESSVSSLAASLVSGTPGVITATFTKSLRGFSVSGLDDTWATTVSTRSDVKWVRRNFYVFGAELRGNVFAPVPYNLDRVDQRSPLALDQDFRLKTGPESKDPNLKKPVIYVLDNGVNPSHVEFLLPNGASRVDNVEDVYNTGFARCTDHPPTAGHGTGVAAIAAGKAYGIAPTVRIKNIKVLTGGSSPVASCIKGTLNHVAMGLEAAYKDILKNNFERPIINMSLGAVGAAPDMETQIQNVLARGAIIVAAAGNEDQDASKLLPAGIPGVLAVGGTDIDDKRWIGIPGSTASNYGNVVQIWAPGHNVLTADWAASNNSALATVTGTSFAAPHVAGAAALLLMQNTGLSLPQAKADLLSRATLHQLDLLGAGSRNALLYVGEDTPSPGFAFQRPVDPNRNERMNAVRISYDGTRVHVAGGDTGTTVSPHGPFSSGGLNAANLGAGLLWSVDPASDPLAAGCKHVEVYTPFGTDSAFYACMGNNGGTRQAMVIGRDNAGAVTWGPSWLGTDTWVGGVSYDDTDFFNPRLLVIAGRNGTTPQIGSEVFVTAFNAQTGAQVGTTTLTATGFTETYHSPVDVVFDGTNVIAATFSDPSNSPDKTFIWKLSPQNLNVLAFWQLPTPSLAINGVVATALAVQPEEAHPTIARTIPAEVFLAARTQVQEGGGSTTWGHLYRLNAARTGVHSNIEIEVVKDAWISSMWSEDGDLYFGGSTTRTYPPGSLYGAKKTGWVKDWDAFVSKTEGISNRRRWIRTFNTSGTEHNFGHGGYGNKKAYIISSDYWTHHVNEYQVY
jgi:serine protease